MGDRCTFHINFRHEDEPVARVLETGEVNKDDLEQVKQYWKILKQVREVISK